jgi:hypothetical protein
MVKPKWLKVTRLRVVVGLGAALVATAAWWYFWPDAQQRLFRKIQPGMTYEQVTEILREPNARYPGWRVIHRGEQWGVSAESPTVKANVRTWFFENAMIIVVFDEDGKAVGAELVRWDKRIRSG